MLRKWRKIEKLEQAQSARVLLLLMFEVGESQEKQRSLQFLRRPLLLFTDIDPALRASVGPPITLLFGASGLYNQLYLQTNHKM